MSVCLSVCIIGYLPKLFLANITQVACFACNLCCGWRLICTMLTSNVKFEVFIKIKSLKFNFMAFSKRWEQIRQAKVESYVKILSAKSWKIMELKKFQGIFISPFFKCQVENFFSSITKKLPLSRKTKTKNFPFAFFPIFLLWFEWIFLIRSCCFWNEWIY